MKRRQIRHPAWAIAPSRGCLLRLSPCCFSSYLRTARTGGFVGSAHVRRVCQRGYANVSCGRLENALELSAGRLLGP